MVVWAAFGTPEAEALMQRNTILNGLARKLVVRSAGVSFLACALLFGGTPSLAKTISGVCPDGSIFIVQSRSAVPCPEAKQVNPNDIPPLNPEFLPRPYGWEQFQGRQDPNNPYNVVDSAPSMQLLDGPKPDGAVDGVRRREARARGSVPQAPQSREAAPIHPVEPFQRARVAPSSVSSAAPLFPTQELRDLALIVELSQRQAPAMFRPRIPDGSERVEGAKGLTLRIAYSASFEPRLRAHFMERGGLPHGDVLLFSVVANDTQPFFGNLTFVQAGAVYHPSREDVRDLGLLQNEFGLMRDGDTLLGYARLPGNMDVTREMDIYWNDRLLTAILKPS